VARFFLYFCWRSMAQTLGSSASASQLQVTDGSNGGAEPNVEELFKDAEHAFGEIFSVQAPRDIFAGMWSAAQCVLSGACLGLAGFIMQPIEGMRDSGVPGCFKGVVLGLCTGVFFTLTGLCTGTFQAVRGAWATPKAVCMVTQGKRWDRTAGRWEEPVAYFLPAEAAEVQQKAEDDEQDEGTSASQARRSVTDTFYYDQLGVSPAASQQDIRKAYFRMSRQWHPDKTSETEAKERFQVISEAYQVLSDPQRRRAYDAQGKQGAGEGFVDAQVFFTVLLGAHALEPLIGNIRLAEMFGDDLFSAGNENSDTVGDLSQQRKDTERSKARQIRRQVRLAVDLAHRLDVSVQRSSAANREAVSREAREILQSDNSVPRFLSEIGWVYRNQAELYLAQQASTLGAFSLWAVRLRLRSQGHKARQNASAAKYAMRSILQLRRIVNEADGTNLDGEEEITGTLAEALPTFLETFWSLMSNDITNTVEKVVERVLSDSSISVSARHCRAEALRHLGGVFIEEAEAVACEPATPVAGTGRSVAMSNNQGAHEGTVSQRRFEEAFVASMSAGSRTRD